MPGALLHGCLDPTTGLEWLPVKVNAEGVLSVKDASMFSPLLLGQCDAAMAVSLNTLVVPNLKGFYEDSFNDRFYIMVIRNANVPGAAPEGEVRLITNYVSATGTFTTANFSANVEANDLILVMAGFVPAANSTNNNIPPDVLGNKTDTAITAKDDVSSAMRYLKGLMDKSSGLAPVVGSTAANWQTAEADIVSIGTNDIRYKLHSLVLDISALTATATITIRMYMQVNGVERKVYEQNFVKGTDPDGLWIVNGTIGIHEVLRVTVQSNNAGDNGLAIAYDYMLEAM